MDSDRRETLYLERAKSELDLARAVFTLSITPDLKKELGLKEDATFFSNVIGNSYYGIFYAAKALLWKKGIITEAPDEHRKTLDAFEKLTLSGEIDFELLEIYRQLTVRADELLGIFRWEKSKRGEFTYHKLPQANLEPAKESLNHATTFVKNINLVLKKSTIH